METVTPALGKDHPPLRAESLEMGKANREVSDVPSIWQELMLSEKEEGQKHSCF